MVVFGRSHGLDSRQTRERAADPLQGLDARGRAEIQRGQTHENHQDLAARAAQRGFGKAPRRQNQQSGVAREGRHPENACAKDVERAQIALVSHGQCGVGQEGEGRDGAREEAARRAIKRI